MLFALLIWVDKFARHLDLSENKSFANSKSLGCRNETQRKNGTSPLSKKETENEEESGRERKKKKKLSTSLASECGGPTPCSEGPCRLR